MSLQNESLFSGFSPESLDFLSSLRINNNKTWFEANKADYLEYLLKPMQDLVQELSGIMLDIDPHFETRPAVNRTISRMQRDTRFSHDKSPYKTAVWLTFKRPRKQWLDSPAFFFEITAEGYRYGMGYYSATKETMDKFRSKISQKPEGFLEAIAFYPQQQVFRLEGDVYKRLVAGNSLPILETWYQRKNLYLISENPLNPHLYERELLTNLVDGFRLLAPLYNYLLEL